MRFLRSKADDKPEEKRRSGLKPLEDDDLDQVSGGTGNSGDDPYQGSTGYETGGFAL